MKTKLIISAVLTAAVLFLNPISFAANNNCSGRACSASSQIKTAQDKAAGAGKKNSTIESSQKTGSVLFDGVDPNLPAKDFDPDSSNPAALTGGG
ncbi:MAG: hypothetical protein KKH28_02280, partial [Elusimicrobia bacterium]|nr:hypothetical protein [Elusimicrobiota bacterium]